MSEIKKKKVGFSARLGNFILGAVIFLGAIVMICFPLDAIEVIATLIALSLLVVGVRYMILYFSLARHMVGGRAVFFYGLMALDLAILSGMVLSMDQRYVVLYLVGTHAFYGVIQLLRVFEERRFETVSWRVKMASALTNLVICLSCIFFIRSTDIMVYIYCASLIGSAILRFFEAFKRNDDTGEVSAIQ